MSKLKERLGPMRAEVLHHLREAGSPQPVAAVAAAVGLHTNTTRFHLDALTEAGLVTREFEQRTQPGRPKALYQAKAGHRADRYQELAVAMVRHFAGAVGDREALAQVAGQAWGSELRAELDRIEPKPEPLDVLVGGMTELGYEPTLVIEPEPLVQLRPCPYAEIAGEDGNVVCQLHLGLARGLLGDDQPWTVTAIEPWVDPTTCLVRLATTDAHAAGAACAPATGAVVPTAESPGPSA